MKAYLQEHLARVAAAMSDPSITVGDDVGVQSCSISSSEKATGVSWMLDVIEGVRGGAIVVAQSSGRWRNDAKDWLLY